MISKNWSRRFAAACGTSLLLSAALLGQELPPLEAPRQTPSQAKRPAIALIDAADAAQWGTWTKSLGWELITAAPPPESDIDARAKLLGAAVADAVKSGKVDAARVYLAGRNDSAAPVFYTISRLPDLFAAGVAVGGSPKLALETFHVFGANFTNSPVLWASAGADDEALSQKLKAAGLNLEWRPAKELTNTAMMQWLSAHTRSEFPFQIDCETNSPAFASCFWIQMVKFDAGERNDVLPLSVVAGDAAAALDLGGFGYHPADPGPGVPVAFLPPKYSGPLRMGDRIVALDGKPIENPHQYLEMLARFAETKPAVVMVERGKERIRVETRVVVPRHDPVVTARVQGHYLPDFHQIEIISRTVTELRVTIPQDWIPGDLFWNGLSLENVKRAGCYSLKIDKELLHAGPCQ
jgi:predicted esterase